MFVGDCVPAVSYNIVGIRKNVQVTTPPANMAHQTVIQVRCRHNLVQEAHVAM